MNDQQIERTQDRVGADPDGFWGPKSIKACQAHLRAMVPTPHPAPKQDQASLTSFFGRAGDESKLVSMQFPIPMFYEGKLVTHTRVHKKCAPSLMCVLAEIQNKFGHNAAIIKVAQTYDGVYFNRAMRNGSNPSLHARGAAIDLDAGNNGNKEHWPLVATMPIEIMEVFASYGWLSAGAFWSRDAMHFQFTQ